MKEFRDELLELLIAHVGEFIDITPLVDKYCGAGNEFDSDDETKIKCRLNINLHLRELKEMGWINTTGELSTGHHMNHQTGKREFILDYRVKARMTTKGELELKALIKKETSAVTNIQNIGVNNGIAAQESDLKNLQAAFQPIMTPQIVQKTAVVRQGIITSIGKWLLNNIVGVVIAGLILAFIIYKLGWNK